LSLLKLECWPLLESAVAAPGEWAEPLAVDYSIEVSQGGELLLPQA